MLGDDLKDLRSGDLRKAIRRGDKFVEKVVEDAAGYIGLAVGNLVNLLGPEVVVLGGGVIEALESELMPVIVKSARRQILRGTGERIDIRATTLGDHARHHRRSGVGEARQQIATAQNRNTSLTLSSLSLSLLEW